MENIKSDAERLEKLWSGEFGDQYNSRNAKAHEGRKPFWEMICKEFPFDNILEVGCNLGGNLKWISQLKNPINVCGIDINATAITQVKKELPLVNSFTSAAKELPFRDAYFGMVFTTGVLIHQSPQTLPIVMSEIVRCSKKYVLCGEYFAETLTEVPYRDQKGALWKRDFGKMYEELFPSLKLLTKGFLPKSKDTSWDDLTYWVWEKT